MITVLNTGGSTRKVNGYPNGIPAVKKYVRNVMKDIILTQIMSVLNIHHTALLLMKITNAPAAL